MTRIKLDDDDLPNEKRDAARWQALLSSARMRVVTSVKQPYDNSPGKYLCIEFWSRSDIPTTHLSKQVFIDYVDMIIADETND